MPCPGALTLAIKLNQNKRKLPSGSLIRFPVFRIDLTMKTGKFLRRNRKGAMAAEYVATLYLLLMFIVFPLINYATVGLRSFFLWFACNEAVLTAVKCKTFFTPVTIGTILYPGAYTVAQSRAQQIRGCFPGINWTEGATNP